MLSYIEEGVAAVKKYCRKHLHFVFLHIYISHTVYVLYSIGAAAGEIINVFSYAGGISVRKRRTASQYEVSQEGHV